MPAQADRFGRAVRDSAWRFRPIPRLGRSKSMNHGDYWIPRIQELADLIEIRLGRQPIFYTSRSYWREFVDDDLGFGNYPLWVVWVNPGEPALPAG